MRQNVYASELPTTFIRKGYHELKFPIRPAFAPVEHLWHDRVPKTLAVSSELAAGLRSGDILLGKVGDGVVDPTKWKTPPQVAFACLGYPGYVTEQDILFFMKTYGALVFSRMPGGKGFVQLPPIKVFHTSIFALRSAQEQLRRAWRDPSSENLKALWLPETLRKFEFFDLPLQWAQQNRRFELRVPDAWTYIRLILARDVGEGIARVCANVERCKHPFFVGRKNQKSCCANCRNALGQRNFQRRSRHGK